MKRSVCVPGRLETARGAVERSETEVVLVGVESAHGGEHARQQQVNVPKGILKGLQFFVGTWKTKGRVGDTSITGTWSAGWARGDRCLIVQASYDDAVAKQQFAVAEVVGWDAARKQTTHHKLRSNGECYTLRWTPISQTELAGKLIGVERGQIFTTKAKIVKKREDQFVYESRNVAGQKIEILFQKDKDSTAEISLCGLVPAPPVRQPWR